MDMLIKDVLDASALRKPDLVRLIEDARLDFYKAEEILDALISNLACRYYDVDMDEVKHRAEKLKKAMQDAADEDEEHSYRNDTDMRQNDE